MSPFASSFNDNSDRYANLSSVIWKLKGSPDADEESQLPATFTDATASGVIQATQEQIKIYKENSKREIAEALRKVPGRLTLQVISFIKYFPPLFC